MGGRESVCLSHIVLGDFIIHDEMLMGGLPLICLR